MSQCASPALQALSLYDCSMQQAGRAAAVIKIEQSCVSQLLEYLIHSAILISPPSHDQPPPGLFVTLSAGKKQHFTGD